ncbi:multidrug ABC transporter ATP-binding protein [Actinorhabdospora filicis]|uniref:Multidrug ABC transporter ATP-binding protein n=1 Tax=Actinorhabdospora filicis TaxID=1785913 RepID=A0A9W6SN60_9ACTN|nr:ABC transporter ATP-binding protein [Actinorhabdospora filicis]GLZ79975.1 multidrug ABC transporter ATP-binding protein [Actinorhabdospora filicis]
MFKILADTVDPFRSRTSQAPPPGVWAFLFRELRPLRFIAALSLLTTIVNASIDVWLIAYAGRLVDALGSTTPERLWADRGGELLGMAAVVLLLRPGVHFLSEALDDIAFRPNATMLATWRAHRHVSRQSVGWFRDRLAGGVATWVRDGGAAAGDAAYIVVHGLSYVLVYIAGAFVMTASMDARLMLPLGLWLVLYVVFARWIVPRYRRASERKQETASELTGLLVDSYANVDTIALMADGDAEDRRDRAVFTAARNAQIGVQRLEVGMNTVMTVLSGILMAGLIGYGLLLWRSGAAPLGLIGASVALSFRTTTMAEWLLDSVSALFGAFGALRRSLQTIAQPIAVPDRPDATELTVTGGAIAFHDVHHRYGGGSGGLNGLDLTVAAGEKVGVVGRSGAGKSTLVNLLLRFHAAESGAITVDGQDIAGVTRESLRRHIAMVAQEAVLLHRSVRENITYGDEDLGEAARRAAADGFVPGLRDRDGRTGLDAHVGERGVRLSGGQRQRVALMRAFHKDAPILVLDEATSALDSEVEAVIQESLAEVMRGRTVIAIAHRLSTIASMDRIVVLDEGRVVEEGTHAALLERGGVYTGLWKRQSGGFLGVEADQTGAA